MNSTTAAIPALSLSTLPTVELSAALGRSFRDYGFAIITDHGIPADMLAQAWQLTEDFFALPDMTKRSYHLPGGGGQRGYTPFGQEIAKNAKRHDLKEFWHVGREPQGDETLPGSMPHNIWPDSDIPEFRPCFTRLFDEFDRLGSRLLEAIAINLGLKPDWFVDPTKQGNSILRLLHYPPIIANVEAESGAVRAGAHEDINLITLLLGAEEAGLQLLDRSGNWLTITPPDGALVVNIGDMMQRLTNSMLPSTTHRVVNPSHERQTVSRYSMPFFLHLRPDYLIELLPGCVTADNPAAYEAITANEYLHERLREIGLG